MTISETIKEKLKTEFENSSNAEILQAYNQKTVETISPFNITTADIINEQANAEAIIDAFKASTDTLAQEVLILMRNGGVDISTDKIKAIIDSTLTKADATSVKAMAQVTKVRSVDEFGRRVKVSDILKAKE